MVGFLDASGTQVVEYVYNTWGKLESVTGAMATTIGRENPLRYRGYYYDEETGFYYLQSRYYDPETGRFLNADETVLTGQGITSGNMYAYCGNNPVMNYDPSGKFAITLTTIILLGMASLITVAAAYEVGVLLQEPVQAAIDALESARLDRKAAIHNAGQQVLGGACLPAQRTARDRQQAQADSRAEVKVQEKVETATKPPKVVYFPANPNDFNPRGLIRSTEISGSNGRVIKWGIMPGDKNPVFEWDEDYKYGPHYHILQNGEHVGDHRIAGSLIEEPYASLYF